MIILRFISRDKYYRENLVIPIYMYHNSFLPYYIMHVHFNRIFTIQVTFFLDFVKI